LIKSKTIFGANLKEHQNLPVQQPVSRSGVRGRPIEDVIAETIRRDPQGALECGLLDLCDESGRFRPVPLPQTPKIQLDQK
jgi:hypothetical protein